MKKKFISSFVFALSLMSGIQPVTGQPCGCYKIKCEVDFKSNTVKKANLHAEATMYVLDINNVRTRQIKTPVQFNGTSLDIALRQIDRLAQDSLICVELSTRYDKLVCSNWSGSPKEFSTKHGYYNIPPNVITILIRDADDRDVLLKTAQLYVKKNVQTGIDAYHMLDSANLDKSPYQKFITKIELAAAYKKAQDYMNQAKIFELISNTIAVDNLPQEVQSRFWKEYYENKMLVFGVDSLKSRADKIAFNNAFGNYVLSDSGKLATWKKYVTELRESEFGKRNLQKLDNLGFIDAADITEQKMLIASGLKIPEKFNDK